MFDPRNFYLAVKACNRERKMKRYISKAFAILMVCALACLTAFAQGKSDRITFDDSFQFAGTTIKNGTYKVTFDETTGELAIKKNEKVIAKAKAHVEPLKETSENTKFSMATENGAKVLRSVTYAGDNRTIVVGEGTASTGSGK
jgi:hypothetical protein